MITNNNTNISESIWRIYSYVYDTILTKLRKQSQQQFRTQFYQKSSMTKLKNLRISNNLQLSQTKHTKNHKTKKQTRERNYNTVKTKKSRRQRQGNTFCA